jgi:protein TonB
MSRGRGIHPAAWAVALLLHGAAGAALLASPPAPRLEAGGGLVVGLAFGEAGAAMVDAPGEADAAVPPVEAAPTPVPALPPMLAARMMADVPAAPGAMPAPRVPQPVAIPDAVPPPQPAAVPLPPAAAAPEAALLPAPPPPMPEAARPAPRRVAAVPSPRAAAARAPAQDGTQRNQPGGGGPAQGPGPDAETTLPPGYVAALRRILERNLRFPMAAREQGLSGTATVRFALARDGRVVAATLARSSGQPSLDREAMALLTRVSPFPPLPADVPGTVVELVVPVVFVLR